VPIYTPAPIFVDNVGQLLSTEDLEIVRDNCAYAELLSFRTMPGFASSGGLDTRTPNYYPTSGTFAIWYGNIRFQTGLTTLTVVGGAANYGAATVRVYVNNTLRITITPGATFSGTWTIAGLADGEVADIRVDANYASGGAAANASFFISAIYASPITYSVSWPGVPTFTTAWTAAKLNQLCDAAAWIYNRAAATPVRPDLSLLYNLGTYFADTRPMYYGSIGKWYSNSQFRFGGNIVNLSSPGQVVDVYFNGVLVYTSPNFAIGTTAYSTALSLASYSVGDQIAVLVNLRCTTAGAQADWKFSRFTMNAARSEVDTSNVYTSILATPASEVVVARATLAAYLNDLSATVLAAHDRIVNTPEVFGRVWAVRRFFSKTNSLSELCQKRARPRFIRSGHRLIVRGKGVTVGWGGVVVPTNDAGQDFDNYGFRSSQSVIDPDKLATQTVYLDTLPNLNYGDPYYIIGDATWVEESIQ
jgi:hypothetical protein